jgi:bacterioferritin (cytochrome b1)
VITRQERDKFIKSISSATEIAQYALAKKLTNDQVVQAVQNLEILTLLKDSNNYNRYCQSKKTQEANDKLKRFLSPQYSELLNTGKWLFNALSKSGDERKQTLLEKELVHKETYNEAVSELRETIIAVESTNAEMTSEAKTTIAELEGRIDTLRHQLSQIKDYISNNYGHDKWRYIKDTFHIN